MSLLPYVLGTTPHRLLDHDLGLTLAPEDLLHAATPLMYYRPLRRILASRDLESSITSNKEKFEINLDVKHFTPEEITVKTGDGYVIIEGKHDEKMDEHGHVSRHFRRRYALPDNCESSAVESKMSIDGVLTVTAPKVVASGKNERSVPIVQTGPVRKPIKEPIDQPESQTDANGTEK